MTRCHPKYSRDELLGMGMSSCLSGFGERFEESSFVGKEILHFFEMSIDLV